MAIGTHKVEVAFNAGFTTPAASRTWTDVSAYVEGDLPTNITRARQDEVNQPPPSTLSLTLNNRDGRFTPEKTAGAYYPNVKRGRPIRITSTYNAVNYTRYLGYVTGWNVAWPDGTDAASVCVVTAASRRARLGRGAVLRSIVEEEILADSPAAYYTLGEPAGATSAADTSGNQAPALAQVGAGAAITFGTDAGPLGAAAMTAATFPGGFDGRYLTGTLATSPAAIEFWFKTATSQGTLLVVPGNTVTVESGQLRVNGALKASGVNDDVWHRVLIQSGTTSYFDGAAFGSAATITGATLSIGGGDSVVGSFAGAFAHVSAYSATISGARSDDHYGSGADGFAGDLAGARISRYASYAAIPTAEMALDTGLATIGHVDTSGALPIDLMERVAKTENGVLYDAKDGTLTFKDRDTRYNLASSFTLSATAQEIEADVEPKDDDQFQVNEMTATANGVPAGIVTDATSTGDFGFYRDDFDSMSDDTGDALGGAQWRVALNKDPHARYSQVTVDVVNSSTAQAALVLAAEVGTMFSLSTLPSQAPATTVDLFIEGYSETITATTHSITFNTSPTYGYTGSGSNGVWQLGVAGRSELGDTTRLAF